MITVESVSRLTGCTGSHHAEAVQSGRLGVDDEILDATTGTFIHRPADTGPRPPI